MRGWLYRTLSKDRQKSFRGAHVVKNVVSTTGKSVECTYAVGSIQARAYRFPRKFCSLQFCPS